MIKSTLDFPDVISLITSAETREYLHDHFEREFDQQMVGSKTGLIVCVPLDCLQVQVGPWASVILYFKKISCKFFIYIWLSYND